MAPPQTVQVDVRIMQNPIPPGPDAGGFELISGIVSGPLRNILNFKNNGHPGFIVIFNIVDDSPPRPAARFRFAANLDEALWVRPFIGPGEDCPGAQCKWSQFEAQAVTGDGQRLIVRNRNEFTQKFGFVLHVTKNANGVGALQAIDPIGNNQNGPQ